MSVFIGQTIQLVANTDLNAVTVPGEYATLSTVTYLNSPKATLASNFSVRPASNDTTRIVQEVFCFTGSVPIKYFRYGSQTEQNNQFGGTWTFSAWYTSALTVVS